MEVQFRLENTYVQPRVWPQYTIKNDRIILHERRKYFIPALYIPGYAQFLNFERPFIKDKHLKKSYIFICFQS